MSEKPYVACETPVQSGRFAAGEDPAKREQILDGAKRVFMTVGFDAASMNDITREAGVSKGTIYVYFDGKDDLFRALMERERGNIARSMQDVLDGQTDAAEGLQRFASAFAAHITRDETVSAMRTMIGVVNRMPKLSKRFFNADSLNVRSVLEDFISRQVAEDRLAVDDVSMAARQFIDLATGTFFKLRLFGDMSEAPDQQEIDSVVSAAVRVFMAAYGKKSQ
ncbi:TetR/AcrR family transcriptional regulator [Rhizobium sp. FKY42]|uniref:TetR/AcrR family transcriptional regulator n=1 Tax=Rhizobium sp. FKY42 TaxID=2562310 RepID=UPI0010C0567F|nr:TetR/AcrR family transcriptional regulator [Rhizobium sp. FKY42]